MNFLLSWWRTAYLETYLETIFWPRLKKNTQSFFTFHLAIQLQAKLHNGLNTWRYAATIAVSSRHDWCHEQQPHGDNDCVKVASPIVNRNKDLGEVLHHVVDGVVFCFHPRSLLKTVSSLELYSFWRASVVIDALDGGFSWRSWKVAKICLCKAK